MLSIKFPAALLKASMMFQAKGDIRYYLNGVNLNPAGYMEASDGHTAIQCKCDELTALETPMIIDVQGKVPAGVDTAELTLHSGETDGLIRLTKENGRPTRAMLRRRVVLLPFSVIGGEFPDISSKFSEDFKPVSEISVNAEYIGRCSQAAKALGAIMPHVCLSFCGESGVITVTPEYAEGCTMLVMPTRGR